MTALRIGRIVMVYLDDIVIYSRCEEEHVQHLELVFARLREAGLRLKPTKCFFVLEEIKLLGYIVNRDGIHTDPEKVKAIAKLTLPRDLKGVRSFLGMKVLPAKFTRLCGNSGTSRRIETKICTFCVGTVSKQSV